MDKEALEKILNASDGFAELGLYDDAWEALQEIPAEELDQIEVILRRVRILVAIESWELALVAATSLGDAHGMAEVTKICIERLAGRKSD
jgi:hypothetical protein